MAAYQQTQASGLDSLGLLLTRLGKFPEAREVHEQALDLSRRLLEKSPTNAHYRNAVAARYNNLGVMFCEAKERQDAEQAYGHALKLSRGLAEEFPSVPGYRLGVARQLNNLAIVLRPMGNVDLARSHAQEALELCRRLVADHPGIVDQQSQLGTILCVLGETTRDQGDLAESRRLLDEAVTHQRAALQRVPRRRIFLLLLRDAYSSLAETLLQLKEHEETVQVALKLPEVLPNEWREYRRAEGYLRRCRSLAFGDAKLSRREAVAVAKSYTEQALELLSKAIALKPADPNLWNLRALHQASLGQWTKVAADYAKAVELGHDYLEVLCCYAQALLLAGQADAYRELCRQIHQRFREVDDRQAYLIARIDTLIADPAVDLDRCQRLAAQAVQAEPKLGWYLHGLGMAHYRAGQFEQAIARLRDSNECFWNDDGKVGNWAALALAHYRLGQVAEARQWLDKFTAWVDEAIIPAEPQGILPMHPHNWFACLILRREVEALFDTSKP